MMLKILTRTLKAFLYPIKCLSCGSVFQTDTHNLPAQDGNKNREGHSPLLFQKITSLYLCPSCNTGYTPVESPYCIKCGTMFKSGDSEDHACEKCIRKPPEFEAARAAGIYDQALMVLIHSLKYKKDMQVAKPLGQILFNALTRFFSEKKIDFAVPVPLHPKRFRTRGFNQAYLLMRKWPDIAKSEFPCLADFHINRDLIERSRNTKPQTGLDRKKRLSNIKGAFRLKDPSKIIGKSILIVDDVMTTGATVNECAKVLKKGGAKEVNVLTLARTRHDQPSNTLSE